MGHYGWDEVVDVTLRFSCPCGVPREGIGLAWRGRCDGRAGRRLPDETQGETNV